MQGRKRQEALIGKLLRGLEEEVQLEIGSSLERSERGQASVGGGGDPEAEALALSWRAGLVAGVLRGRGSRCASGAPIQWRPRSLGRGRMWLLRCSMSFSADNL